MILVVNESKVPQLIILAIDNQTVVNWLGGVYMLTI